MFDLIDQTSEHNVEEGSSRQRRWAFLWGLSSSPSKFALRICKDRIVIKINTTKSVDIRSIVQIDSPEIDESF